MSLSKSLRPKNIVSNTDANAVTTFCMSLTSAQKPSILNQNGKRAIGEPNKIPIFDAVNASILERDLQVSGGN